MSLAAVAAAAAAGAGRARLLVVVRPRWPARLMSNLPVQRRRATPPTTYKYFKSRSGEEGGSGSGGRRLPGFLQGRQGMVISGTLVAGGLYYVTHLDTVPETGRRRLMTISADEEQHMGEQAYEELLQTHRSRILPAGHPIARKVEAVGRRVAAASPLAQRPWTFTVIDSPEANCFVLPGQHVFVYTGILPILHDDAGLAAVMGHEVAHQVARHTAEKISLYKVLVAADLLLFFVFGTPGVFRSLLLQVGLELPFSRQCEREADHIGLYLAARACFDPEAAVGVFQRMQQHHGSKQPPAYLSTHPSHSDRIKQLKQWLPGAQAVYHRCGDFDGPQPRSRLPDAV